MKKTIYDFENKYEVQDDLLIDKALEGLDERTLHETIKAMLINTVKDCIKYETWMDPDMAEISNLLVKEEKTEDEMRRIKNAQNRLRNSLHFARISENIQLAYRNIKKNKGSKTAGTNNNTIIAIGKIKTNNLVQYVRNRLADYRPQTVRRVEIPKPNGKTRPLGIPTIEDRLIQQCIKQVLEPICEAKFHKDNYGFRPNRGTNHAIAMAMRFANINKLYHVVDIDIHGFFDNVDHSKLLKQIWSIGIQDKNLICIISKMLKAEIKGVGIPTKGVPQGRNIKSIVG